MGESKQKGKIIRYGKYLKILVRRFFLFSFFPLEIKSVYVALGLGLESSSLSF